MAAEIEWEMLVDKLDETRHALLAVIKEQVSIICTPVVSHAPHNSC